jgi:hypothetical protein
MSAGIKDAHFEQLKTRYPAATRVPLPSGAALVAVPEVTLPSGWSAQASSVRFIEPAQYPFACPDCFWADEGLRLANNHNPQNSQVNGIPETSERGLWFSWHVRDQWNPSSDTLLTWMGCILDRFRRAQ